MDSQQKAEHSCNENSKRTAIFRGFVVTKRTIRYTIAPTALWYANCAVVTLECTDRTLVWNVHENVLEDPRMHLILS